MGFIIGILVVLSVILTVNVLFPALDVPTLTAALFAVMTVLMVVGGAAGLVIRHRRQLAGEPVDPLADVRHLDRNTWRMPALALVSRPVKTRLRTISLVTLRGYLIVAVILIAIKLGAAIF